MLPAGTSLPCGHFKGRLSAGGSLFCLERLLYPVFLVAQKGLLFKRSLSETPSKHLPAFGGGELVQRCPDQSASFRQLDQFKKRDSVGPSRLQQFLAVKCRSGLFCAAQLFAVHAYVVYRHIAAV